MNPNQSREFPAGRLTLLAPAQALVPRSFENVHASPSRYDELLAGMQRLRGKLYLEDGAISESQLAADGRHRLAGDEQAWHVLALDDDGEVGGCARYIAYPNTVGFSQLSVRHAAIASSRQWGSTFRAAVAKDIETARRRGVSYVEVGGWALAPKMRRTREALRIALATYGLARVLGGCIGIATATRRHCSSEILRRLGGQSLSANLTEVPAYFDPQYGCEMEVVRFDSVLPDSRFESWVNDLSSNWLTAPVVQFSGIRQLQFALTEPQTTQRPVWQFGEKFAHAIN